MSITVQIVLSRPNGEGGRSEKSHARFSDCPTSLCQTKSYRWWDGVDGAVPLNQSEPDCGTCARMLPAALTEAAVLANLPALPAGDWLRIEVALNRSLTRTFLCSPETTFDDLGYAINDHFNRDDDHLWHFDLRGRRRILRSYEDGEDLVEMLHDDGYEVSRGAQATLGAYLHPGELFSYLFDYGDNWRHALRVLETLPAPPKTDELTLVDARGNAPAQYR